MQRVSVSVSKVGGGWGGEGGPLTALLSSITPFRGRTFMLTTLPRLMDSRNGNLRYLERKSDGAVCFGGTNLERSQFKQNVSESDTKKPYSCILKVDFHPKSSDLTFIGC